MQHSAHHFQPVSEGSQDPGWVYAENTLAAFIPSQCDPVPIGLIFHNHIPVTEKEVLQRLSHELKQTSADTRAILLLIYNLKLTVNQIENRIRRFGLQINKTTANPQGIPEVTHPRRKQQKKFLWFDELRDNGWLFKLKKAIDDKRYQQYRAHPRTPDVYLFQEEMLASVHDYIRAFFNLKGNYGVFSKAAGLDPSGATEEERKWKYLSDRVWGAGDLVRQGDKSGGVLRLGTIYKDMEHALNADSLQMMVRIWRICRYLIGMGKALNDPGLITRLFLEHFRDHLKNIGRDVTPVFRLFNALSKMSPDSLMYALRIGHLRAMQSFEESLGTGHPVILSMWVFYANQWKLTYMSNNIIIQYYNRALETADRELGPTSDTAISISHDHLYFVYYNIYDRDDESVNHLALDLRFRIMEVIGPGPLIWNTKTQYLTFAVQILARVAYRLDDRFLAQYYLENVVTLFWDSDAECRVRASKLLCQLAIWLREWGDTEQLAKVEQQKMQLEGARQSTARPNTQWAN